MIITSQGFAHYTKGINNQDFGIHSKKAAVVLDGCSAAKYAESGNRLFGQLFSRKEDWDNLESFEHNVKSVFDDILRMVEAYYPDQQSLEKDYIMNNLLFTIIACFDQDDKFVVKLFGDGYIITENAKGLVSYMRFAYGNCPPYYAYKYCHLENLNFTNCNFKTFTFSKSEFKKIAVATDGFQPIVLGNVRDFDNAFKANKNDVIKQLLQEGQFNFGDDVTFVMFETDKENEEDEENENI